MAHDDVTVAEVYRRLVDMDTRWGGTLERIEEQVQLTNGRTTRLEERVNGHDREIRDLRRVPGAAPPQTSASDVITIPINAKTLTALVLTVAALVLALVAAAKGVAL